MSYFRICNPRRRRDEVWFKASRGGSSDEGGTTMLTKIALSAVIALGAASGALAATKHVRHSGAVAQGHVHAGAYDAYGFVNQTPGAGRVGESGAILIQDRGYSSSIGTPYCGGSC